MTNVVQVINIHRFTRMDNDLYDSLISADLSGRALRIAMAIHRHTIGFNREAVRVTASYLAEATGITRENVSRIISDLLRQNVLVRKGGSRSPIGLNDPAKWAIEDKSSRVSKTAQSVINKVSRVSELTHKKDTKTNPLSPSEMSPPISDPVEPVEPKPKAKPAKNQAVARLLDDNPHFLPEQILIDWVALRRAKRAPLSTTVWNKLNAELDLCVEADIPAEKAMEIALLRGWQGFTVGWVQNHLKSDKGNGASAQAEDWNNDTSWAEGLRSRT